MCLLEMGELFRTYNIDDVAVPSGWIEGSDAFFGGLVGQVAFL
jgi:hypothetical protein